MAKLTLTDVTSGYASTTAVNANNALIETALENTLSRDGTSPNAMLVDLDMNGHTLLNLNSLEIGGQNIGTLVASAATSASNASTSASNAATSETNAAASAASALNSMLTVQDQKIIWKGAWSGATTYNVNDAVSINGNSYICILTSLNNTPPNGTYWNILAEKGAPGAGTGDMLGANNLSDVVNKPTALATLGGAALAGSASQVFSVAAATADAHAVSRTFGDGRYASLDGDAAQAFSCSTLDVGHASDTTITRKSAGRIAIEGIEVLQADAPILISTTTALSSTHLNKPLVYTGASAGTLTLPETATNGDAITLYVSGAGVCTLQRFAPQDIYAQGKSAVTSLTMEQGAMVKLVWSSASWIQCGGGNSVGYGQTWQTLTGSRTSGTTYYNTTGKPIFVNIAITAGSLTVVVDGVTLSTGAIYNCSFIVPVGSSYSATYTGIWTELR
jgi:hypothetical protein